MIYRAFRAAPVSWMIAAAVVAGNVGIAIGRIWP